MAGLAALVAWAIVVLPMAVYGANARLYRHFAVLAERGIDVFDPNLESLGGIAPRYLDYTPLNFAIYQGLLGQHSAPSIFVMYQFAHLLLVVASAYGLSRRGWLDQEHLAALITLVAFNPGLFMLLVQPADDKILYLSLPLAALWLASIRPAAGYAALGVYGGWSGAGVLVGPVVILNDVLRNIGRHASVREIAKGAMRFIPWILGLTVALLPYFPRSLRLAFNRIDREQQQPFWFSIWHVVGDANYRPWLRATVVALWLTLIFVLSVRRRLDIFGGVALVATTYMLFSNNTVSSRILTTAILFIPALRGRQVRFFALFMLVYTQAAWLVSRYPYRFLKHNDVDGYVIDSIEALIVNSPLLVGIALVLVNAWRGALPHGPLRSETFVAPVTVRDARLASGVGVKTA